MENLIALAEKRKEEYNNELNQGTDCPVYYVYDLVENYLEGDVEVYVSNNRHKTSVYIDRDYVDPDDEDISEGFRQNGYTIFYTDKLVAMFLTREDAIDYLKYQKHNMSEYAYYYIDTVGYGNKVTKSIIQEIENLSK